MFQVWYSQFAKEHSFEHFSQIRSCILKHNKNWIQWAIWGIQIYIDPHCDSIWIDINHSLEKGIQSIIMFLFIAIDFELILHSSQRWGTVRVARLMYSMWPFNGPSFCRVSAAIGFKGSIFWIKTGQFIRKRSEISNILCLMLFCERQINRETMVIQQ